MKAILSILLLLVSLQSLAYIEGSIDEGSTNLITYTNRPVNIDIFNPPKVQVSNDITFTTYEVGDYLFSMRLLEDIDAAKVRLNKEYPEVNQLRHYISFAIWQPKEGQIIIQPTDPLAPRNGGIGNISMGWKYARLDCTQYATGCPDLPPVDNPPLYENSSKRQILGLITRLENIIKNKSNTRSVLTSISGLFDNPEEVTNELRIIKKIIRNTPEN